MTAHAPATSPHGRGSALSHRDCAQLYHTCTRTGLAPPTSAWRLRSFLATSPLGLGFNCAAYAQGLGASLIHVHRDGTRPWAPFALGLRSPMQQSESRLSRLGSPCHICTRTAPALATFQSRLGSSLPHVHRYCTHLLRSGDLRKVHVCVSRPVVLHRDVSPLFAAVLAAKTHEHGQL